MRVPDRAEIARRLFGSVRRQRPSTKLEARILAAGRAELERGRVGRQSHDHSELDARRRSEEAPNALRSAQRERGRAMAVRRWVAVGTLGAAAAGLFVYLGLGSAPEGGVLISAERPGTSALARESSESSERAGATRPPESRPQPALRGGDARGPGERDGADEPDAPRAEAGASGSEVASRERSAGSRRAGSQSERAAAPLDTPRETTTAETTSGKTPIEAPPAATARRLPMPAKFERSASSPEAPRASLGQQLGQIKEARAALRAGDHQRAIELLEAYRAQPAGAEMAAEASLLRIEALAASGQREAAAQAARQFARDYPNSPLIDHALSYASGRVER